MFSKIISKFFNKISEKEDKVIMRKGNDKFSKLVLIKTREEVVDNYVNGIVLRAKLNESKIKEREEKQNIFNILLNACNYR
ncbi:MAG: hypothetical protein MJ066_00985 [Clostridia bacterium]|nr:hypothetical protein [Clostridia bacterium]